MKTKLLALALLLVLASPAMAEQIEAVHLVQVRGTTYEVVEVQDRGRYSIPSWNILRGKRGKEFVRLRLHGSDLPLCVQVQELPKGVLREIPDRRPIEQKHPIRAFIFKQGPGVVMTLISFFI